MNDRNKLKKSPHEGDAFAAYLENDSRNLGGPGTDRAYSNGFKFSYIYAQDEAPTWSKRPVHSFGFLQKEAEDAKTNVSISFAQQIYTPNDTSLATLIKNDRPYGAWMYVGFGLSFKEPSVAYYLETDVGMVGPSALGEQVQNGFHDLIHDEHAKGWANGLKDEPTLQIFFQERFKTYTKRYVDFIPYYGLSLGNVQIAAQIGGLIRFGLNLPSDFGPTRPSASDGDSFVSPVNSGNIHKHSAYIFAGIRGNALARNIFLDGNTLLESQHVKKYPINSDTEVGFGFEFLPVSVAWSYVVRSPEFEEQSNFNSFASISFVYAL